MLRLTALSIALLSPATALAQCYYWVPTTEHTLTTTLLTVKSANPPRSFSVRLRGATLPRYEGACERESLFAQLSKAKIMIEVTKTPDLRFCDPEQDGDVVVATVLVNGENLSQVLARQGLAQIGESRGWCGNTASKP